MTLWLIELCKEFCVIDLSETDGHILGIAQLSSAWPETVASTSRRAGLGAGALRMFRRVAV
jgi:hypothetical protein